jgi:hypothetical protein
MARGTSFYFTDGASPESGSTVRGAVSGRLRYFRQWHAADSRQYRPAGFAAEIPFGDLLTGEVLGASHLQDVLRPKAGNACLPISTLTRHFQRCAATPMFNEYAVPLRNGSCSLHLAELMR